MSGRRRLEPNAKKVMTTKWRRQRCGERLAAHQGRHFQITVDRSSTHSREDDEEEGQRARRLPGDGDAAVYADGDCVRGGVLVREEVQRESVGPLKRGKFFAFVFLKKPDAQLENGTPWLPCDRTVECVFQVVNNASGGPAARRKGTD